MTVSAQSGAVTQSPTMSPAMSPSWRLACVAAGLLTVFAALLAQDLARGSARTPAQGTLWVADRDAGYLYELDEDLFLARRVPCPWPLDVERSADGGLFVLRSGNAGSAFGMRLAAFDAEGTLRSETWLDNCSDLSAMGGRSALLMQPLDAPGRARALAIDREGTLTVLGEGDGWNCICGWRGTVLVGTQSGRIECLGGASRALERPIADLVAGAGSLYALEGGAAARVHRLGPALELLGSHELGFAAAHISVGEQGEVWVADRENPRVRCISGDGSLRWERNDLPLAGLDRTAAGPQGSVLAVAPGALLRLDVLGRNQPGQGGFQWLSDVCR